MTLLPTIISYSSPMTSYYYYYNYTTTLASSPSLALVCGTSSTLSLTSSSSYSSSASSSIRTTTTTTRTSTSTTSATSSSSSSHNYAWFFDNYASSPSISPHRHPHLWQVRLLPAPSARHKKKKSPWVKNSYPVNTSCLLIYLSSYPVFQFKAWYYQHEDR